MMCQEIQTIVYESFGAAELPEEARAHLAQCAACRGLYEELRSAGVRLGGDASFHPDDFERSRLLVEINGRIDALQTRRYGVLSGRLRWMLPLAASVALLTGVVFFGSRIETERAGSGDSLLVASAEPEVTEEELALYDDLDERTVDVLLEDYSSHPADEPSGALLEDLTEDEYEYLTKTFDVGDML